MTPTELALVSVAGGASIVVNVWSAFVIVRLRRELARMSGQLVALQAVLNQVLGKRDDAAAAVAP